MIIPDSLLDRHQFYEEIVRQCTATRTDRFNFYQVLRNYYLFGSADAKGAPYNKIGSTIETLSSFIYSPDTLRFSLMLGTEAPEDDVFKAVELSREVTEQWRLSRSHILFGLGLRWAHVFGIMLMKTVWDRNRVRSYLVEPHQFGVWREDLIDLADQEAFTHHYVISKTALYDRLNGNPRRDSILSRVGTASGIENPMIGANGLSRLLVGAPVGGVSTSSAIPGSMSGVDGGIGGGGRGPTYDYAPQVSAELVDMVDIYVWDDEQDDYRVITRASPDVYIFDREAELMGHVKGIPPFTVIRPEFNLYDYFYGSSFAARLTWLQDWRTDRTYQIRNVLTKQVDPPMTFVGGGGISDEKLLGYGAAGGRLSFPTPGAKVDVHRPDLPADVFAEVNQIAAMFDDVAGLGHVLQGKGEPGVRSRGQADLMARLGSSRPKERAIAAEESAEELAGTILRLVQDHSDQRFQYTSPTGHTATFIAEQFTRDYEVKVDAHSSSPIFVEDRKHDAITLLEAKAIDRETLLDMFDPPNLQDLKERLKKIEKAELEQRREEMQMQAQAGKAKGHKAA